MPWQRGDVEAVVAMLAEDATLVDAAASDLVSRSRSAHELPRGLAALGQLALAPLPARANGQPALGFYSWDPEAGAYLPFALNVLTLRGSQISDVTAFVARSTEETEREAYARWPEQPADPERLLGHVRAVRSARPAGLTIAV